MNIIPKFLRNKFASGGGYDATVAKGKRKPPVARSRSEDAELNNSERQILSGSTRNLRRNFAIAAWAIRKHLDYVSKFTFQCRCSNSKALLKRFTKEQLESVDAQVESIVKIWSRAQNFDAGKRHSMSRMIRLCEALRTVDGDVLPIQRKEGTIQLVESDRIKNPIGAPSAGSGLAPTDIQNIINGVLIDRDTGAALGYCVHKRDRTGITMTFERLVPAAFSTLHGYFDRYDQVRGISPLAAAVNSFQDIYESIDYTLAKEKVGQLFALAVYRKNAESLGVLEEEEETDADGEEQEGYSIDFGRGPFLLDLDDGDEAKVLESANPSMEAQAFWQFVLMIALKSLDIPLSFFDESHTNYSGLRVAWIMYDQSAETKREDNRDLLSRWTAWKLSLAILDDELVLPAGMRITDIAWEWIANGVPWVDQLKEVTANIAAVAAGLADPQEILKSQGLDPFEVLDRRAEFEAYAASKGVLLSYNLPKLVPEPVQEDAGDASGNSNKSESKTKKSSGAAK